MYSLWLIKHSRPQLAMPKLLAILILATRLPAAVLAGKSETESDSCCSGYTKQVVKRGFFNRFERSYWMVNVCGTQKMAVVLKLKKQKAMCADPEMEWVKLLMKRIDTEKKHQSVSVKVKTPEKHSSINNTPGTESRPASTVPTSRPVTITHKQARTDPTHSAQGSSDSPANPQRGAGTGIPTTKGQTRPNPATAEGDTTGVRSPWAGGTPTSSPTTSVRRERTGSLPESTEQRAEKHQPDPEPGTEPDKHFPATSGTGTRTEPRPASTVPTSRPVTITHKQARTDPTHSAQGSSDSPANPQRGEGAGIPTTEGQTRPNPATAEGDTTGVRSPWAGGTSTSSPTTSVRRERTGSLPESTEQRGRGSFEQPPSETRASSLSLGKAQSDGATTVSPLPWLNVARGTVVASGQEGGGRPGRKLSNSKVAVLILLPVTLLLFSGIVYLYCKKKRRADPTYHVAPTESTEGIYDAL